MRHQKKRYLKVILVFASMIAVLLAFTSLEYTRKVPDTGRMQASFHLTAEELVKDFVDEESRATEKYSGSVLNVYGMIDKIEANEEGYTLFLKSTSSQTFVMCQFGQENAKDIEPLKEGMLITVKGVCSGYLMDIVLDRCVIQE